MTVVVGLDYLSELLIISDTRVSYPDGTFEQDYGVQKTIVLREENGKVATLSFCGRLSAVQAVVFHLDEKFRNLKRPFVPSELQQDVQKWIQEVTKELPGDERQGLWFLYASLEPSRNRPFNIADQRVVNIQFPERCLCVFSLTKDGEVQALSRDNIQVIGSGNTERGDTIRKRGQELIGSFRGVLGQEHMRANLISLSISREFEDSQSTTVGGAYQTVRIVPPPDEIRSDYNLFKIGGKLDFQEMGGRTKLIHRPTNEEFTILPIRDPELGEFFTLSNASAREFDHR